MSSKEKKSGVANGNESHGAAAAIRDYLVKVEKNLKGFTREAKDSILSEIEGHILERIEENEANASSSESEADVSSSENEANVSSSKSDANVSSSESEANASSSKSDANVSSSESEAEGKTAFIQEVLDDFGDPGKVARDFSPVLRTGTRKLTAFQLYSIGMSVAIIGVLFKHIIYMLTGSWWKYCSLRTSGIFVMLLIYFATFYHISFRLHLKRNARLACIAVFTSAVSIVLAAAFPMDIVNVLTGEWEDYISDRSVILFILLMAYFNIFFQVMFRNRPERLSRFSSIMLFTNTFLGIIFLFMFFEGMKYGLREYFDLSLSHGMISRHDVWYYEDDSLFQGYMVYAILRLVFVGTLAAYFSYLGYINMSRDTADGISPLKNISFKLLAVVLIWDVFFMFYLANKLRDVQDLLFVRTNDMAFIALMFMLAISISIGALFALRWKYTFRIMVIDRELFAFTIAAIVLFSVLATALQTGSIEVSENASESYYADIRGDQPDEEVLYGEKIIHNGSYYSLARWYENGYHERDQGFVLYRITNEREIIEEVFNITVEPGPGYANLDYSSNGLRFSGGYIHAVYRVWNDSTDWDKRNDYCHYLISIDGQTFERTEFSTNGTHYRGFAHMMVEDTTAWIFFREWVHNESTYREEGLNLSKIVVRDGRVVERDDDFAKITFDPGVTPPFSDFSDVEFFDGKDSISLYFWTTNTTYDYLEGQLHEYYNILHYFTQLSLDGEVVVPFTQVWKSVRNDYMNPTPYAQNTSLLNIFHVYDNLIFASSYEWDGIPGHPMSELTVLVLDENGSFEKRVLKDFGTMASWYWYGTAGATDSHGTTRIVFWSYEEDGPQAGLHLEIQIIDPGGRVSRTMDIPLDQYPNYELIDRVVFDPDNDMIGFDIYLWWEGVGENISYLVGNVYIMENCDLPEYNDWDEYLGVYYPFFVEISGNETIYTDHAPRIRDERDDNVRNFNLSVAGGLLGGLVVPLCLWRKLERK